MSNCTYKGGLEANKVVMVQQVPKRNYPCKQIMFAHRILSTCIEK